jgi:hypothetical protein
MRSSSSSKAGDHIVSGESVYGGSMRLMRRIFEPYGLQLSFVDTRDIANVERAITPATRLVYCETPTNPMMFLTDLRAVGDLTASRGILFAVDNTFMTPMFQRPLELGADIVLPLHHQVPQRPQRHGRRPADHPPRRPGRAAGLHPERQRRRAGTDGLLAGAPGAPRPCRSGCASTTRTGAEWPAGSKTTRR